MVTSYEKLSNKSQLESNFILLVVSGHELPDRFHHWYWLLVYWIKKYFMYNWNIISCLHESAVDARWKTRHMQGQPSMLWKKLTHIEVGNMFFGFTF